MEFPGETWIQILVQPPVGELPLNEFPKLSQAWFL